MKKIQLLATRPYGHCFPIVSWLIRLTQWSSESHVVMYFPENQKIRHARFNEIVEEDIDCFMLKNRLTNMRTILLDDAQFEAVDQYSKSKLGKQCGYWSTLIGSFIPQMIRKIGITVGNPFYKGLTCSEYFRETIRKANPQLVMVLTKDIPKGIFSTEDALELAPKISK